MSDALPETALKASPTCVASWKRIWWAYLLTGKRSDVRVQWSEAGLWEIDMDAARDLCAQAHVPLATLYLPDPTRRQMLAARLSGWFLKNGHTNAAAIVRVRKVKR